jgi:hypothetical protein
VAGGVKNLADATFNERDDFTALFEKKESSYENYRNQLMAASCTNLKPHNLSSLHSVSNNKAYMTAEDPDRPINAQRYEDILVPLGSVILPGGRTLVDEHFNHSHSIARNTTLPPRLDLEASNNTPSITASDMRTSGNRGVANVMRLEATQRLLELEQQKNESLVAQLELEKRRGEVEREELIEQIAEAHAAES